MSEFLRIPKSIRERRRLSWPAKAAACHLAFRQRGQKTVSLGVRLLAKNLGMDKTTAARAVREAIEAGLVRVVGRGDRGRRIYVCSVRILRTLPESEPASARRGQKCPQGADTSVRKARTRQEVVQEVVQEDRLCTETEAERSADRTSCPIPKIGTEGTRLLSSIPSSASVSANGNGDGRRRSELLDLLARAVRLQAGGLRTEARVRQFRVDCVALEGFLDLALGGRLGPVPQACDALLAKAENLGRSTVRNRMAALTVWVQKQKGGARGDTAEGGSP